MISDCKHQLAPDEHGHKVGTSCVCTLGSTQHGGSDYRRPSNLETGAPVPTPFAPQNTVDESKFVFLHCIPPSQGCLGHQTASEPSAPPTKVVITNKYPLQR